MFIVQTMKSQAIEPFRKRKVYTHHDESLGQLVLLGFDVAIFTPAAYQRHRL